MKIHEFNIKPILIAKEALNPDWSWDSSVNKWTGFHLWYMTKNGVTIRNNNRVFNLTEGDTFLFDLTKVYHCTHDPEHPASMYTAYFHCDEVQLLQTMLKNNTILEQNHPTLYNVNVQLFEEAINSNRLTREETEVWLGPVFQQVLTRISHVTGKHKITEIRQMIDAAPQNNYSLEELSAAAGYSKNQFVRVFRQATGYTPYAYLLHAKILRAQNLLLFSDYSVTEIARMLGYNDPNHFSAQFYQKTGCYPSQYATTQKNEQSRVSIYLNDPE